MRNRHTKTHRPQRSCNQGCQRRQIDGAKCPMVQRHIAALPSEAKAPARLTGNLIAAEVPIASPRFPQSEVCVRWPSVRRAAIIRKGEDIEGEPECPFDIDRDSNPLQY